MTIISDRKIKQNKLQGRIIAMLAALESDEYPKDALFVGQVKGLYKTSRDMIGIVFTTASFNWHEPTLCVQLFSFYEKSYIKKVWKSRINAVKEALKKWYGWEGYVDCCISRTTCSIITDYPLPKAMRDLLSVYYGDKWICRGAKKDKAVVSYKEKVEQTRKWNDIYVKKMERLYEAWQKCPTYLFKLKPQYEQKEEAVMK